MSLRPPEGRRFRRNGQGDPRHADTLLLTMAGRLFDDLAGAPEDALWAGLDEAGLTAALAPEALGGAGLGLDDGLGVMRVAAAAGLAVPLAETMLAGWLLARGGLRLPAGPVAIAPAAAEDRFRIDAAGLAHGRAGRVARAGTAGHLAVLADGPDGRAVVALVAGAACTVLRREDGPAGMVIIEQVKPLALGAVPVWLDRGRWLLTLAIAEAQRAAGAGPAEMVSAAIAATEALDRAVSAGDGPDGPALWRQAEAAFCRCTRAAIDIPADPVPGNSRGRKET